MKRFEQKIDMPKCLRCGSRNIIKYGIRVNKETTEKQRFSCKDCYLRFIINSNYNLMGRNPQFIDFLRNKRSERISYRKLARIFEIEFGIKINYKLIWYTINKNTHNQPILRADKQ